MPTILARTARYAILLAAASSAAVALAGPPPTEKRPVTDEIQGVKIVDEYRWLENAGDKAVQEWSDAQNAYARSVLNAMPCVPALGARMKELEDSVGVQYHAVDFAGGVYFASKSQPPKQQPMIVTLSSLSDLKGERVVIDPNQIDASGHTAFDWFRPSPDGKYVAVSLSKGGSESGDVHVFKVTDGSEVKGDMVPRVNGGTAGGSLAWLHDSSGFFYSRDPRKGERSEEDMDFFTQVWFHRMGTPTESDKYECGKDYPKIAEIELEVSPDGNWALTNVQNGDGGEFIQDVRSLAPTKDGKERGWMRLSKWTDGVVEAKFGHAPAAGETVDASWNALYLVSRKNAPMGKVLRLALVPGQVPSLAGAVEVVPEQKDASIETSFEHRAGIWITKNRLYVLYQIGGPNELRQFQIANGHAIGSVPQPDISTIGELARLEGDELAFEVDSFTMPPAFFHYVPDPGAKGGELKKTALAVQPPPHMPKLEVKRDFATSKDGTKVPVNIIMPAGTKPDGKTPTLVWGYGGYGVNETPGFSPRRIAWVEQGCIFVVANIRGGGEYGEQWHTNGNLLKKQNVFDDFYAAAKFMIDKGYTNKDKLAIIGGSNGGLLMGATFTQHPDLCKAVVSQVGIYDMLRVELSANGAFNVTEFGTVKDSAQFQALFAYSPYHHVKDGTHYPAILFTTGANDPRVDPMQSRKMTARLQAAQSDTGGGTVLLSTNKNAGHGMGSSLSDRISQSVDVYGFLFEQLGVAYKGSQTSMNRQN